MRRRYQVKKVTHYNDVLASIPRGNSWEKKQRERNAFGKVIPGIDVRKLSEEEYLALAGEEQTSVMLVKQGGTNSRGDLL